MAKRSATTTEARPEPSVARRVVQSPWFWPCVIFALAFVLRLVYVLQIRYTPFFQTLGLDAKYYDRWAREIAEGRAPSEAYFMTPLYPYFLATIYRLFGRDLLLVRLIQAGLGSLSAVLVFYLGTDVFDRRVGILAGLVTATYGALIFYDGSILLTPLLVLLNLLSLFLLVRADITGKPVVYAMAGLSLGFAAVGRAAVLAFIPVALVWVWLGSGMGAKDGSREGGAVGERVDGKRPKTVPKAHPRKSGAGRSTGRVRAGARAAALVLLGVLVVIVPVTVRNYVVARDFVIVTSNGGLNFYIGNSEIASGSYVRPEGLDIVEDADGERIAEEDLGPYLEVDYYARQLYPSDPSMQIPFVPQQHIDVLTYGAAAHATLLDTDSANRDAMTAKFEQKKADLRRENNRKVSGRQTIARSAADVFSGERVGRVPLLRASQLDNFLP